MLSVQSVVAEVATFARLATWSSPERNCAWSSRSWRSLLDTQLSGPDMPMPRRSTATTGRVFNRSTPPRCSHTGSWCDVGMSDPVVMTIGPASAGVVASRARTTPMLTVPAEPPRESRSAS
ncbi:Uncharacterised protein [Mycobacteroides abscessus subsp. abscessus]|nr:Uncharacterised protein [Mycobacteroides abscessus subsp. abscessus]